MTEPLSLQSPFLRTAHERGFIHQATDLEALDTIITTKSSPLPFYIGFDATADSLHVGNLMTIMLARLAQKSGLKPIILLGGGTTKIGDPSGKTQARQLLSDEVINTNITAIKACFSRYLSFETDNDWGNRPADLSSTDAVMVNNDQWLKGINYIDFLRDFARHFSVNRMLTMDNVKLRLEREQPLSFLEFNYMILQAYDYYWLNENLDCALQMGGSDQWGNIVMGVDMVRRLSGREVFGLTTPLIMTAAGEKMGKTHNGAVWLSPNKLSPFDFWQFWRNCDDGDVIRFLKFYTDLPLSTIADYAALEGASLNEAKICLANETTRLLHGQEAVDTCLQTAQRLFKPKADVSLEDIIITGQDPAGHPTTSANLPTRRLPAGTPILEVLKSLGFATSNGEGRRLIQGRGVKINDGVVEDETRCLTESDFNTNGLAKISVGKKRHGLACGGTS